MNSDPLELDSILSVCVGMVQSRVIGTVLSPAVQLWLRSQVEAVEALQFHIEGGDRQILSGQIPKVTVAARNVIYQGISLSQIYLSGEGIQVNLGQVIKGKPLRLMQVVPVQAEAILQQADLNASLQAPLLSNALTDLLMGWLRSDAVHDLSPHVQTMIAKPTVTVQSPQVALYRDQLDLSGYLIASEVGSDQRLPFTLRTNLQLTAGNKICLHQPHWLSQAPDQYTPMPHLNGFEIDLGSEVNLRQLHLDEGQMICRGQINILP